MITEMLDQHFRRIIYSIFSLIIFFCLSMLIISLNSLTVKAQGITFSIDANVQYQTIEGFGGFVDGSAFDRTGGHDSTPLWDMIVNDLGISIIRIGFPSGIEEVNDNDDPFNTNWSAFMYDNPRRDPDGRIEGESVHDIKALQKLHEAGINKFFMCAWTYPPWLCTSGYYNGKVIPEKADELAELIYATVKIYEEQFSIPITHVSIYNEPNIFWVTNGREVSDLVIVVKKRLKQEGMNTKVVAAEYSGVGAVDLDGNPWIYPDAFPYLDVYTYHNYTEPWFSGGGIYDEIRDFTSISGIPTWQTEACNYILAGGDMSKTDTYEEGLYTAVHIHNALVAGNSTAWLWWLLYAPSEGNPRSQGQRLIEVDWSDLTPTPSPKYYALKQYSRYIPIGAKRIDLQGGDWSLLCSAFLHPNNIFTLVATNLGEEQDVSFKLNGINLSSLNRIRFSDGEKSLDIGSITVAGANFSDCLKGYSITTYTTQSANLFVDETPPTPPIGLLAQAVNESQINLTWYASSDPESGIREYKIFRDGIQIVSTSNTSYSDRGLSESTTYIYTVIAVNGVGLKSNQSNPVQATTYYDTTPPTINQVNLSGSTLLNIVFSEPVEEVSAEDISNYFIDNGVVVIGADLNSNLITVHLTTTAHTSDLSYRIHISNVRDRALVSNVIVENSSMIYVFSTYERRVNSGGDVYTDVSGKDWAGDQTYSSMDWGYIGGETLVRPGIEIVNTSDDVLYQSERWGLNGYRFDLPNGNYRVRLHFAEIWEEAQSPGQRILDVWVEGEKVLDSFDIFAEVGYQTAIIKEFTTEVTDEQMNIDFSAKIYFPKVSAIEILSCAKGTWADKTAPVPPIGVTVR